LWQLAARKRRRQDFPAGVAAGHGVNPPRPNSNAAAHATRALRAAPARPAAACREPVRTGAAIGPAPRRRRRPAISSVFSRPITEVCGMSSGQIERQRSSRQAGPAAGVMCAWPQKRRRRYRTGTAWHAHGPAMMRCHTGRGGSPVSAKTDRRRADSVSPGIVRKSSGQAELAEPRRTCRPPRARKDGRGVPLAGHPAIGAPPAAAPAVCCGIATTPSVLAKRGANGRHLTARRRWPPHTRPRMADQGGEFRQPDGGPVFRCPPTATVTTCNRRQARSRLKRVRAASGATARPTTGQGNHGHAAAGRRAPSDQWARAGPGPGAAAPTPQSAPRDLAVGHSIARGRIIAQRTHSLTTPESKGIAGAGGLWLM